MGSKGASSQVIQYVPVETTPAEPIVQPAIAKSVTHATDGALAAQQRERASRFGIRSTYDQLARKRDGAGGGTTLGGS